jgi:uncharacterized C2H2 Zn-finger protein
VPSVTQRMWTKRQGSRSCSIVFPSPSGFNSRSREELPSEPCPQLDSLRRVLFVDVASFVPRARKGASQMSPRKRAATKQKAAELVCPECGKTFTRPASLGAHRNRAHGVAGASAARATAKKATRTRKPAAARSSPKAKAAARSTATPSRRKATSSSQPATAVKRQTASRPSTPRSASSTRGRHTAANGHDVAVNRDQLLQALFPTGIPARDDAIRQVNAWLDEAERLAHMR